MNKINQILKNQMRKIKPPIEIFGDIDKAVGEFCLSLDKKLKKRKIKAEIFIGGSLAKNTLVRKDKYDVDIFVRFDKKYKSDEISKLLGNVLGKTVKKIHGSRDYYQKIVNGIIMEIVPVMKIKKPEEAQNITDLSYFHVSYILSKLSKNNELAKEIILAKTFTHAQNCYGAESYIHGFSGYALELLICYYGSFLKFVKEISKINISNSSISPKNNKSNKRRLSSKSNKLLDNKVIIDPAGFYKNKNSVLKELNKSKTQGPIILIDPTFRQRNALAGLSDETFLKFQKNCKSFLKKPNDSFFEKKNVEEELKKKYGEKLNIVCIKTNKQAGDIAGSKSKKFFNLFSRRLGQEFKIKKLEFNYDDKKNIAYFFVIVRKKKDEIIKGPHITKVENLSSFKKAHPKAFIKNHFAYIKISHKLSFKKFFNMFKKQYKKVIKEMGVKKIDLV